jgi:hypothetical protein
MIIDYQYYAFLKEAWFSLEFKINNEVRKETSGYSYIRINFTINNNTRRIGKVMPVQTAWRPLGLR